MSIDSTHMFYLAPKDEAFELYKMKYNSGLYDDIYIMVAFTSLTLILTIFFGLVSDLTIFPSYSFGNMYLRYGTMVPSSDLPFYDRLVTIAFDMTIMLVDIVRRPLIKQYQSLFLVFIPPTGVAVYYSILTPIDFTAIMCFMHICNFVLTFFTRRFILVVVILTCIYQTQCIVFILVETAGIKVLALSVGLTSLIYWRTIYQLSQYLGLLLQSPRG